MWIMWISRKVNTHFLYREKINGKIGKLGIEVKKHSIYGIFEDSQKLEMRGICW